MSNHTLDNLEFEAEIYYLKTEEGGRQTAVATGYRGQFYYDGKNWDAAQHFVDRNTCKPGETINVLMRTASRGNHIGKLFVNKSFVIREGARVVGVGRIIKILVDDFNKRELDNYENRVHKLILADTEFGIHSVHDLDGVKSLFFDRQNYLKILPLIKSGKWYMIPDWEDQTKKKSFDEYLNIETFTDQQGQKFIATIYDNDMLWQDPQIIDIFQI